MAPSVIILAAGKGTRMEADLPKVLHQVGGAPMLLHVLQTTIRIEPEHIILVTGHGAEAVEVAAKAYDDTIKVVLQQEQKGTAHAVLQAKTALTDARGDTIVLYGDTPFVRSETLLALLEARRSADIVVLGFEAADPKRYGRLVMQDNKLTRIVEYKDANAAERAISLCNSGVLCADSDVLFSLLGAVDNNNAAGE